MKLQPICDCELSERLLYTSFILLMGLGYLMALAFLYTSFENVDGKPGLSVGDIAEDYYGNRSGSRLEAAIRGPMSAYIQIDDRSTIVSWLKSGASQKDYESEIKPILAKRCFACHTPASGLAIPNLSTYEGIQEVTNVDTGMSIHSLMKISHIHLFGIGLILFGVGMVFRRVEMRCGLKSTLIVLPFVAILVDIMAWFLTKWDPIYAYTVVIAGAVLGLCLAIQIFTSLYQMWFKPPSQGPCQT
ncbi:MAG: hypothetical protein GXP17_11655 [Gammaproteobacteria bacterium]|nr:hypothetical protein [Gammaproteobacteria bacterium]